VCSAVFCVLLCSANGGLFSQMSDLLSVFNWNVRGLNSLVRRETVRDMVQSVKPVVVCLQETKLALFTQ
jgi:hypothetical protein